LRQNFSLPTTIPCSFAVKLHSEYEAVKAECDPWILSLAPAEAREMVLDSLLPRYVCRLFPTVPSRQRLNTVTKFIGWLTLADDVVDNMISGSSLMPAMDSYTTTAPSASSWAQSVLSLMLRDHDASAPCDSMASAQYLHGPSSSSSAAAELYPALHKTPNPQPNACFLLDALSELWADISCGSSTGARARFVAVMEHHFAAVCLHERLSSEFAKCEVPMSTAIMGVEEYMAIRRGSSGFLIGERLLQYALGLDDDPVDLHPLIAELLQLVVDYMCICNDLVSCRAEISKGDYFNLPSIVYNNDMNNGRGSFQDAIDVVVGMMDRVDARCVQLLHDLRRDKRIARLMRRDPRLAAYLDNMVSFMSGTLRWSFETVRYGLRPSTPSP
jgi:hypothetical protein